MKFGKRLESEAVPEWRKKYIRYKYLKKVIKRVGEANGTTTRDSRADSSSDLDIPLQRMLSPRVKHKEYTHQTLDEILLERPEEERNFFTLIEEERHNVESFFQEQETAMRKLFEVLVRQTRTLIMRKKTIDKLQEAEDAANGADRSAQKGDETLPSDTSSGHPIPTVSVTIPGAANTNAVAHSSTQQEVAKGDRDIESGLKRGKFDHGKSANTAVQVTLANPASQPKMPVRSRNPSRTSVGSGAQPSQSQPRLHRMLAKFSSNVRLRQAKKRVSAQEVISTPSKEYDRRPQTDFLDDDEDVDDDEDIEEEADEAELEEENARLHPESALGTLALPVPSSHAVTKEMRRSLTGHFHPLSTSTAGEPSSGHGANDQGHGTAEEWDRKHIVSAFPVLEVAEVSEAVAGAAEVSVLVVPVQPAAATINYARPKSAPSPTAAGSEYARRSSQDNEFGRVASHHRGTTNPIIRTMERSLNTLFYSSDGDIAPKIAQNMGLDASGLQRRIAKWRRARKMLKRAFFEYYRGLELLKNYRVLNWTGFVKIMKKFDKTADWNATAVYLRDLEDRNKLDMRWLDDMIKHTESTYAESFEQSRRDKAMKFLRIPDMKSRTFHENMFRSGLLVGVVAVLLGISFYNVYNNWTATYLASSAKFAVVRIYAGFFIPVIFAFMATFDLYVWTKNGINYVYVFEFNPRNYLSFHEYFEFSGYLLLTWASSFFIFTTGVVPPAYDYLQPLVLISVLFLSLVVPIRFFFPDARLWIVRTLVRLAFTPLLEVQFRDFFIADELNSMVHFFTIFNMFICASSNAYDPVALEGACSTSTSWAVAGVSMIPAYIRFVQSFRRWFDSRAAFPHLANAGKYFFSMMSILTATAFHYMASSAWATVFLILYICVATITTFYTYTWDIVMDWGLFQRKAASKFLRSELLFSYTSFYYFAMISNFFMRSMWALNLTVSLTLEGYISSQSAAMLTFGLAVLEVGRRIQWNILRVENEHTLGFGHFRVIRKIELPYPVDKKQQSELAPILPKGYKILTAEQRPSTANVDDDEGTGQAEFTRRESGGGLKEVDTGSSGTIGKLLSEADAIMADITDDASRQPHISASKMTGNGRDLVKSDYTKSEVKSPKRSPVSTATLSSSDAPKRHSDTIDAKQNSIKHHSQKQTKQKKQKQQQPIHAIFNGGIGGHHHLLHGPVKFKDGTSESLEAMVRSEDEDNSDGDVDANASMNGDQR